ncbi:hypothetical protein C8J56DRAFT_1063987 [Mycena floridula]|nr:hypothetical protein C8J56DRAFT_1063987 [Mycena floridula]
MFPDKVERLTIDGVLDMDAYFSGEKSRVIFPMALNFSSSSSMVALPPTIDPNHGMIKVTVEALSFA